MYKQVIILSLYFISLNLYGQRSVYEGNKKIGYLHEAVRQNCENCYYWDTYDIFRKKIKLKLPVYEMGREENGILKNYFENQFSIEVTELSPTIEIIKFNNTSNGNSDWLYFKILDNKIFIVKQLSYYNSTHKIKLDKDEDYDYLPATEVCQRDLNIEYKKSISYKFFFENRKKTNKCYQCPIDIKLDDCLKSTNKKYKWK